MNKQLSTLTLLKRVLFVLMTLATAGILSAIFLTPLARADTPIYARPGGHDYACNGTANVDYDPGSPRLRRKNAATRLEPGRFRQHGHPG